MEIMDSRLFNAKFEKSTEVGEVRQKTPIRVFENQTRINQCSRMRWSQLRLYTFAKLSASFEDLIELSGNANTTLAGNLKIIRIRLREAKPAIVSFFGIERVMRLKGCSERHRDIA